MYCQVASKRQDTYIRDSIYYIARRQFRFPSAYSEFPHGFYSGHVNGIKQVYTCVADSTATGRRAHRLIGDTKKKTRLARKERHRSAFTVARSLIDGGNTVE